MQFLYLRHMAIHWFFIIFSRASCNSLRMLIFLLLDGFWGTPFLPFYRVLPFVCRGLNRLWYVSGGLALRLMQHSMRVTKLRKVKEKLPHTRKIVYCKENQKYPQGKIPLPKTRIGLNIQNEDNMFI